MNVSTELPHLSSSVMPVRRCYTPWLSVYDRSQMKWAPYLFLDMFIWKGKNKCRQRQHASYRSLSWLQCRVGIATSLIWIRGTRTIVPRAIDNKSRHVVCSYNHVSTEVHMRSLDMITGSSDRSLWNPRRDPMCEPVGSREVGKEGRSPQKILNDSLKRQGFFVKMSEWSVRHQEDLAYPAPFKFLIP